MGEAEWQPVVIVDPYPEEMGSEEWEKLVGQRVMVSPRVKPSPSATCMPDKHCGGRSFTVSGDDAARLGITGPRFVVCEHQILTD
jgi:hypothetical protein